jgi:nuclear control of ATPase protein 2
LWKFGKAAYEGTRARLRETHTDFSLGTLRASLFDRNLFRRIAFPTRLPGTLAVIDSSLDSLCRHEIEMNVMRLRALRELQAAGLGLLVSEGIEFGGGKGWKEGVVRGVDMMKSTMEWLQDVDVQSNSMDQVDDGTDTKDYANVDLVKLRSVPVLDIAAVSTNLLNLAQNILPNQDTHTSSLASIYGRPSLLTRYWPLGLTLLFSGSTILRLLLNKRQQLAQWGRDTYTTIIDFWQNWVVTPVSNIIGTIRHEDSSQIALMGRQSLQSDMDSLERMVVDFAKDNTQYLPTDISSSTFDAMEIVRRGVKEGDLSPVLRAYENDLKTPVRSAISGTLVRTLLIQVQKTKVDVEVALSGIDRLLKSQQLVFGFVGVTPSLIILYTALRYISSLPSRRRGFRQGIVKSDVIKTMRNIERILCLHDPTKGDVLTFKDRGLLLCECYLVREFVRVLPRGVRREFMEDMADLENIRLGVERQLRTVARIWRVWGKYLV